MYIYTSAVPLTKTKLPSKYALLALCVFEVVRILEFYSLRLRQRLIHLPVKWYLIKL